MTTTIISLTGTYGQGKSETLRRIIALLEQRCGIEARYIGKRNKIDVTAVLDTPWGRIGITTKGDPGTLPHLRVQDLVLKEECVLVLCSTRSSGRTLTDTLAIAAQHDWTFLQWSNIKGPAPHDRWNECAAHAWVHCIEHLVARG